VAVIHVRTTEFSETFPVKEVNSTGRADFIAANVKYCPSGKVIPVKVTTLPLSEVASIFESPPLVKFPSVSHRIA